MAENKKRKKILTNKRITGEVLRPLITAFVLFPQGFYWEVVHG